MFLSPRWEGDLERDDCASSSNSSVTEEGLSDTVDREAFPRKEGESMHTGFGPRGSKSNFTTVVLVKRDHFFGLFVNQKSHS